MRGSVRLYGHGHVGPDGRWVTDRRLRPMPIEQLRGDLAELTRSVDRMRGEVSALAEAVTGSKVGRPKGKK